jgi:hypothetical protein
MRRWLLAWALCAFSFSAQAQIGFNGSFPGPGTPHSAGGGSFTGIGDVQSGAEFWVGDIAYSAAYAAALGNSFDFSCNAGGVTGTIPFKSDGTLNLTGTITICVGTISVTKLYDQSGASFCATSVPCDYTTITSGSLTFLQSGCPATSVKTYCLSASGLFMNAATGPTVDQGQPFTVTAIFDRSVAGRGFNNIIFNTNGSFVQMGGFSTNDQIYMYAGSNTPSIAMTDGAVHTVQTVFNDASSTFKVDNGSATTVGSTPGTFTFRVGLDIGGFTGFFDGIGAYGGALSTTVQTNLAHNECVNSGSTAAPGC